MLGKFEKILKEHKELFKNDECEDLSIVFFKIAEILAKEEAFKYSTLESIKDTYKRSKNIAKCKYAVCDYYEEKKVYCITDDLSEAVFESFVSTKHPGDVVYDLEKDKVVWETKDLCIDKETLEIINKLKKDRKKM